jgi:hypothetical protein
VVFYKRIELEELILFRLRLPDVMIGLRKDVDTTSD